jgi:hypothetical protein
MLVVAMNKFFTDDRLCPTLHLQNLPTLLSTLHSKVYNLFLVQPCSLPKPTKCKSITSLGASSHLYNYMKNVIWALQSKHTNFQGIDLPSIPTCHVLYVFQTFLGNATIQFPLSILSFNPKSYSRSNCMMRSKISSTWFQPPKLEENKVYWKCATSLFRICFIRFKIWYMGNIAWENNYRIKRLITGFALLNTDKSQIIEVKLLSYILKLQHFFGSMWIFSSRCGELNEVLDLGKA